MTTIKTDEASAMIMLLESHNIPSNEKEISHGRGRWQWHLRSSCQGPWLHRLVRSSWRHRKRHWEPNVFDCVWLELQVDQGLERCGVEQLISSALLNSNRLHDSSLAVYV